MIASWLALSAAIAAPPDVGFSAGSYGRVQAATDLAGGGGSALDVVSHPPRLGLGPYMELDLKWRVALAGESEGEGAAGGEDVAFTVLITPALSGDIFHYDGDFGEAIALRNFYVQADLGAAPVSVWAGSRMYRGDDVYLLDFWPLDNLNTYGGGVSWAPGRTEVAAHVGVNRLRGDDWQVQEITVATPGAVAGQEVLVLDRQRIVTSLRAVHHLALGPLTLRGKVYGELHTLPGGTRYAADPFDELFPEPLPGDLGTLVGLQISLWGWAHQSFVHAWVARSTGLAAYGELTIPTDGLAADLRTAPAERWMFALAGNTETSVVGVQAAVYASSFHDADGQGVDFDDRWEFVAVARPQVYATPWLAVGIEASHQVLRPSGLNPRTASLDVPQITKLSLIPAIQAGKGGFSRPRIHLVYTAPLLDRDARAYFDPLDVRVAPGVQHTIGLGAEWWINAERVITPGQ